MKISRWTTFRKPADLFASLLIFLFTYAACSKMLAFEQFRNQMLNQPFNTKMALILSYLLPVLEIYTVAALMFEKTRKRGLWLSLILMAMFTGYVLLVITNFWPKQPCSCGGILKMLSWKGHLVLNATFLLISIMGLILTYKERRLVT